MNDNRSERKGALSNPRRQGSSFMPRVRAFAFLAAASLFAEAWPYSRDIGILPYAGLLILALLAMGFKKKDRVDATMIILGGLSLFYMAMSYGGILPRAWTKIHDNRVILQQALGYITMPIFVGAFSAAVPYFLSIRRDRRMIIIHGLALINLVLPALIMHSAADAGLGESSSNSFINMLMLNTLFSTELITVMWLGYIIIRAPLFVAAPLAGSLLIICTNIQPVIAIATAILFKLKPFSRAVSLSIACSIAVAVAVAPFFSDYLISLDVNTGIRAQFWREGFQGLIDSYGLGVGFGTEGIRPRYIFHNAIWKFDSGSEAYLLVGLHNSFVNIAFRMGVVGLALILYLMVQLFPSRFSSPYIKWIYIVVLLDLCVNVALESVIFNLGLFFAFAILRLERSGDLRSFRK